MKGISDDGTIRAIAALSTAMARATFTLACTASIGAAQVPRVAPPPPCRVDLPAEALLRLALPSARAPSLAVLPFTQGVVERQYTHVPWILAERVRHRLRVDPGLVVAGSGQTARAIFEGGGSADSARKLLNTQWLVTGVVEPARLDTRVHVMLAAKDQKPVWEQTFMLSQNSMADIEQMLADSVTTRLLRRTAPGASTPRLAGRENDHAFSAALLLLAEHTLEASERARQDLETLFRSDTSVVVAVTLARATVLTLERGAAGTAPEAAPLRRIDALLAYAEAHDSTAAEIWTVRAMAARYRDPVRFSGAETAHRRALQLDSRSADAANQFGVTLLRQGKRSAARAQLRRALDLDPGNSSATALLAELERLEGRAALTCGYANASIAADPFDPRVYGSRALARLELGQARESYADAETAMRLSGAPWTRGIRLMVEVASKNTSYAQSLARQYAAQYLSGAGVLTVEDALSLARAFAALGFDREAMGALSRARPVGRVLALGLREPIFSNLRRQRGFDALISSVPPTR